jgi:hypothetical protein
MGKKDESIFTSLQWPHFLRQLLALMELRA